MEIKLKYTGDMVEVNSEHFDEKGKFIGFLAGDPAAPGGEVFYPKEDVAEAPDWDAYRMEAAKDILCALLQKDGPRCYSWWTIEQAAQTSVKQADELIKQLQEK